MRRTTIADLRLIVEELRSDTSLADIDRLLGFDFEDRRFRGQRTHKIIGRYSADRPELAVEYAAWRERRRARIVKRLRAPPGRYPQKLARNREALTLITPMLNQGVERRLILAHLASVTGERWTRGRLAGLIHRHVKGGPLHSKPCEVSRD